MLRLLPADKQAFWPTLMFSLINVPVPLSITGEPYQRKGLSHTQRNDVYLPRTYEVAELFPQRFCTQHVYTPVDCTVIVVMESNSLTLSPSFFHMKLVLLRRAVLTKHCIFRLLPKQVLEPARIIFSFGWSSN